MNERKSTSTNYLNESFMEARCVLNRVLKILGKRWIPEILLSIEEKGVQRFSTLKEVLQGISDQMLANCLAELVQQELVEKKVLQEAPMRATYSLTPSGSLIVVHLHALCHWGRNNLKIEKPGKAV